MPVNEIVKAGYDSLRSLKRTKEQWQFALVEADAVLPDDGVSLAGWLHPKCSNEQRMCMNRMPLQNLAGVRLAHRPLHNNDRESA
jgi:hypothetical protein